MKSRVKGVVLVLFSLLGLVLLICIYTYLDRINIGTIIGSRVSSNEKTQLSVSNIILSTKTALLAVLSFLLGKFSDLFGLYEKWEAKRKEQTPSISFEVNSTTNPRMSPPDGTEEIISLCETDISEKVYVLCSIKNQGNTEVLAISLNGVGINCPSMCHGASHSMYLQLPSDSKKYTLNVRCQNSKNVFYCAEYCLIYNQDIGSSITVVRDFVKGKHNGR